MKDNLARNYNLHNEVQPKREEFPQTKPKTQPSRKKRFTRLEKAVMSLLSAGLFGLLLGNVSMAVQLSSTSREVQDINRQITETEILNQNLEQNVQELSRYDRVYEIANKYGLELNEENIRNVAP